MHKFIFAALLLLSSFQTVYSQKVTTDKEGNYIAVKGKPQPDKATGKTFTDSKGNTYPVYLSKNGKLYVIRTSKSGNEYRQYLKVD